MRGISHHILGEYLIDNSLNEATEPERKAFLFGCTEPDRNITTYLKGTFTAKAFHGHNFENCQSCIMRLIRRLSEGNEGILYYYRLGKLTHYILDSFTWPHNNGFQGSITDHVEYEHTLHPLFCSYLEKQTVTAAHQCGDDYYSWFLAKHREYLETRTGMEDDCSFAAAAAVTATVYFMELQKSRQTVFSSMPAFF